LRCKWLIEQQGLAAARQLLCIVCRTGRGGYGLVIGGFAMKKTTLIAGLASVGAVAAVLWTVPAVASTTGSHDTRSGREDRIVRSEGDEDTSSTSAVPEPGTLALLGLGLSGLGLTGLGRKRTKK
jgi:hypothetical protein